MDLTDEDVREILRIVDESKLDELRIQTPGFSLHVRRGDGSGTPSAMPAPASTAPMAAMPVPAAGTVVAGDGEGPAIEAPMLGTFYRSEGPGQEPFVDIGDRVEPGTVVCLIEVMKLMNHIQAGMSGTVVQALADNGALVEFGQPLFRIAPDT